LLQQGFIASLYAEYSTALDEQDRGLGFEIAMGVCRNFLFLESLADKYIQRSPGRQVKIILYIGMYQLLFLDRVPAYAAVNTSVELCRKTNNNRSTGLINGVLKKVLQNQDTMPLGQSIAELSLKFSHPKWLIEKWIAEAGITETLSRLSFNRSQPKYWMRVNPQQQSISHYGEQGPYVEIPKAELKSLLKSNDFEQGFHSIQDPASWLVYLMLELQADHKVLDACAAPGGKSALILEQNPQQFLVSADLSVRRLKSALDIKYRLGLQGFKPVVADALSAPFKPVFDRILLDAPCSNLGVVQRRPEAVHGFKRQDLLAHQRLQISLIKSLASFLKPGGLLVYATCSPEPEETFDVLDLFLKDNPEYVLDPALPKEIPSSFIKQNCLSIRPGASDLDGFFATRIKRL
jgi:16S rRNA (cytosine967-C5)-methyltransferase